MSDPDIAPLRRNRDFTRLWVGEGASRLGSRVARFAYPLLVLELTGSPAQAGLVAFAVVMPWFLLSLPAGVLVDRWNRKRVMLTCDLAALTTVATLPAAYWLLQITFLHVVTVALLENAFYVFFYLAEPGAIRRIVPAQQLPDAVARNEARERGATLVGPALGGLLFSVGRVWPFVVDALSYLASIAMLLSIKTPFQEDRRSAPALTSLQGRVAEGFAGFWREPFIRSSELLAAGTNVTQTAVYLAVLVVAADQGASAELIGVMFALIATGGLAGALAAPRLRRLVRAPFIILGLPWAHVAVVPVLAIAPNPLVLGGLTAAVTFLNPTWNAVAVGYQITVIPDELQGRVRSVSTLISFSTAALGPLLAGFLLERISGEATFGVLAAYALVVAIVGTTSDPLRRFPELDQGQPPFDAVSRPGYGAELKRRDRTKPS